MKTDRRTPSTIAVVINPGAGGVTLENIGVIEARLKDVLGTRLQSITYLNEANPHALDRAFATKPDAVVVVGGDGTARAAAMLACETGIPVAPLPGGTLNIFPKRAFGTKTLVEAIESLATAETGFVPCGRADGQIFLVAIAIGGLVKVAALREAARQGSFFRRIRSVLRYLAARATTRRVAYRVNGGEWRLAHALVGAIGRVEDAFGLPDAGSQRKPGEMDFAAVEFRDWGHIAGVMAAALTGTWKGQPDIHTSGAETVELRTRRKPRPIPALLDGELLTLSSHVTITYDTAGIPILMPIHKNGL